MDQAVHTATTKATTKTTAEAEIRSLIDSWQKAATAGDLDAIMSHYAPEVVAYDAVMALQFKGIDAYGKHWQACLSMCSAMSFKIHDLTIAASDDIAFSHCLTRCGGVDKDGNENASWMRVTAGYRKTNGQWLIVHDHFSAPFDMESGKALFDLQP